MIYKFATLLLVLATLPLMTSGSAWAWTEERCSSFAQLTMLGPARCNAGGCCWKPLVNWGPVNPDLVIQCCSVGYMCQYGRPNGITAALMQDYQTACIPQAPRSNTCKLEDIGAAGPMTLDLTIDCNYGSVCRPMTYAGSTIITPCLACSGNSNPGVCFKSVGGTITNNCCSGFMCPDVLNVNQTSSCIPGNEKVFALLRTINGIITPLGVMLGMLLIVHSGYKLMTSQGDPTKLQEGKDGLTSAIIGLLFVLMAVSILRVIIKALITGDTDPFS